MILLSTILLAATISTTDNREFFPNLTSRWPTAVSEYATPGSSAYDYAKRITVTNAAALYAIFNAYYERIYYFNCGSTVTQELLPDNFDFFSHVQYIANLDRFSTPNDSLTALSKMSDLGRYLQFSSSRGPWKMYVYEWPKDYFWVGSSKAERLVDGTWETLDPNLPNFSWRRKIAGSGDGPGFYMQSCEHYMKDGVFNISSNGGAMPSADMWLNIIHGDALNGYRSFGTYTNQTSFAGAVQHYFTSSTNGFYDIRYPTNILQRSQDWMSSAGRSISLIDRVYSGFRYPDAAGGTLTWLKTSRSSSYTISVITMDVTIDDGGLCTYSEIAVPSSYWTVGDINVETNIVASTNVYEHAYELHVSPVDYSHNVGHISELSTAVAQYFNYGNILMLIQELIHGSYGLNDSIFIEMYKTSGLDYYLYAVNTNTSESLSLPFYLSSGTFTFQGDIEMSQTAVMDYVINESSVNYDLSVATNALLGMKASKSEYVTFNATLINDNNSDSVGALPSGSDDYTYATLNYMANATEGSGPSLTNAVWGGKYQIREHCRSVAKQRWGDYTDAKTYANVSEEMASVGATSSGGSASANVGHYNNAIYGYILRYVDGTPYLIARTAGSNEVVVASGEIDPNLDMFEIEYVIDPKFTYTSTDPPTHDSHKAVGDGYLTQRITFDFDSLKLSDE